MKWYDYLYILPIAIIVAIVATPFLWLEAVLGILAGAKDTTRQTNLQKRT
ncbi:hypothetical protein LCGC14_2757400, partial [marine sediment metagenome]